MKNQNTDYSCRYCYIGTMRYWKDVHELDDTLKVFKCDKCSCCEKVRVLAPLTMITNETRPLETTSWRTTFKNITKL